MENSTKLNAKSSRSVIFILQLQQTDLSPPTNMRTAIQNPHANYYLVFKNLLKAPPRTKQPPLLFFILVLIFPPRIPACEDSVNRSLLCAPSLHRNYTYFSIHQFALTNFYTFSHFSALFHPKTGYIFFSKAEVLLLLLLSSLSASASTTTTTTAAAVASVSASASRRRRRRRWALFSSSEQKNKKRSFDRGEEIFSLATHGSPSMMLHFFTRVLALHLNMMHLRLGRRLAFITHLFTYRFAIGKFSDQEFPLFPWLFFFSS